MFGWMDKDTGNFDTWILIHKFLGRKRNGKKYGRGIGLAVVCASELNAQILKVHILRITVIFFFQIPVF